MIDTKQLIGIARQLFWWKSPEEALANPRCFLAQVMTLGTWAEVQQVKEVLGWDAFKDALLHAPPGVMDARSWAYWHCFLGLPESQMPRRSLT